MSKLFPTKKDFNVLFSAPYRNLFLISAIVHLVAAFFSDGFLQYDEHFEILEFLGFKLGITPESDLTMEYGEMMRPWIQPFIYFPFLKTFQLIGIENRFLWVFALRLISAIVGFYSILTFSLYLFDKIKKEALRYLSVALICFTWFIPFIHVRTSCEALGGSVFMLAFALTMRLLSSDKKSINISSSITIGVLFGLSFAMRYHIGFMILFFFLWLLIFRKTDIKTLFFLSLGVFAMIGISVLIDYWGYQKWAFAPYQYYHQNIVLKLANKWGVSPWWGYFKSSMKKGTPIIALPIIITTLYFWVRHWKHELTWVTLPFFFVHSYVAHKELRFLFPILPYLPLFLVIILSNSENTYSYIKKLYSKKPLKYLCRFVIVINFILLFQISLRTLQSSVSFYKWTYHNKEQLMDKFYVFGDLRPYGIAALNMHFYNFHYPKYQYIPEENIKLEIDKQISSGKKQFFSSKGKHFFEMNKVSQCKNIYLSVPKFALKLNIGNWINRSEVWSVFECQND